MKGIVKERRTILVDIPNENFLYKLVASDLPAQRTCTLRPRTSEHHVNSRSLYRRHAEIIAVGWGGDTHQTWDLLEALSTYIARFWAHAYGSWILTYTRSRALVLLERTLRHISESGGKSCEMLGCPLSKVRFLLKHSFTIFVCMANMYSIFSLSNTYPWLVINSCAFIKYSGEIGIWLSWAQLI